MRFAGAELSRTLGKDSCRSGVERCERGDGAGKGAAISTAVIVVLRHQV